MHIYMRKWSTWSKIVVISLIASIVYGIIFFLYIVYVSVGSLDFLQLRVQSEAGPFVFLCGSSFFVFVVLLGVLYLIFLSRINKEDENY